MEQRTIISDFLCLISLSVTRGALFLESTINRQYDESLGVDFGVSRKRDTESGLISRLTIVVRSEKVLF